MLSLQHIFFLHFYQWISLTLFLFLPNSSREQEFWLSLLACYIRSFIISIIYIRDNPMLSITSNKALERLFFSDLRFLLLVILLLQLSPNQVLKRLEFLVWLSSFVLSWVSHSMLRWMVDFLGKINSVFWVCLLQTEKNLAWCEVFMRKLLLKSLDESGMIATTLSLPERECTQHA